jgi:hypothetical protein
MQRDEAAKRAQDGVEWHPRLFRRVQGGPGGPEEGEEDLEWIINAPVYGPTTPNNYCSLVLTESSDGATPKKQEEQILAIYPVLKGQQPSQKNSIPPRNSLSGISRSKEAANSDGVADLIDFGGDDAGSTPAVDTSHQGTAHKEDGPLLDFQEDMKKDLPAPSMKAGTTQATNISLLDG